MNDSNTVTVWDISIRVFHWTLVVAFSIAYITGEIEGDIHAYPGYLVLGLLIYRLAWGLVGTRYARFSSFLFGPNETKSYIRSLITGHPRRYLGHNPAGAIMVFLLLLSLAITVYTGLEAYAQEGRGPLAGASPVIATALANGDHDNDDEDDWWEEIHEFFSHLTLLLVGAHIIGALVASVLHRENLVRAMITGRKRRDG